MAGLYEALLGSVGNENDYLAQDPLYQAARSVASWQLPAPRNNTDAFLMPLLQTGLSGALANFGRDSALDSMYTDTRTAMSALPKSSVSSLLAESGAPEDPAQQMLAEYSAAERPDEWTAKSGKADLAKAILTAQLAQDQEAKQQAARDEIGKLFASKGLVLTENGKVAPIAGFGQALGSIAAAEEAGKTGGTLPGVPGALRSDAIKEAASVAQKDQSFDFIDKKYEQAKDLVGTKAAAKALIGLPTEKGNELEALGDSLVVQIDTALGRELNSDVRKRLLSLAPKWYDSDSTIDQKKKDMKDLVGSLSKATPILDSAGLTMVPATAAPTPVAEQTAQAVRMFGGRPYVKVPGGWKAQ